MDDPRDDAESVRALNALRRLVRALRAAGRDARRKHAVTSAQLFVLRELGASPGMALGELAQRVHTSQSTVSEVVGRLVDAGFVRRRTPAADGRRRELTLSARGRNIVDAAPPSTQERLIASFRGLPASRREAIAAGLEAWVDAAGLAEAPAPMFFERSSDRPRRRDG